MAAEAGWYRTYHTRYQAFKHLIGVQHLDNEQRVALLTSNIGGIKNQSPQARSMKIVPPLMNST